MIIYTYIKSRSRAGLNRKLRHDVQLMNWLFTKGWDFFAKNQEIRIHRLYSCEIKRGATIPVSTNFIHTVGIVIGNNVVLEENVRIFQNVTLGAAERPSDYSSRSDAMPKVCKNVTLCAGAVIIGGIVVGEGCVIAANAIVTKDVPPFSLVTGVNNVRSLIKTENS